MENNIHPLSIVSEKAKIGKNVKIGPFCTVGPFVVIEDDVELVSHVVIDGRTRIGQGTKVFPFACLGLETPDLKYKGEPSEVIIGKRNKIREYVTIHPGTENGIMKTVVGDDCLLMVGVHVAHDCILGNNVIMANYANVAGHVIVEDFAIIGGLSAVSQFVRVGAYSFIGGMTGVCGDLIPFGSTGVDLGYLNGLNLVGLKRKNFSREQIDNLRSVYNDLFLSDEDDFNQRLDKITEKFSSDEAVMRVVEFVKAAKINSICMPKKK